MRKAIDPGVIAEVDGHFWTEVRQVMLTNEHIAKINHAIDDRSSCPSETGELTFTFDKISYNNALSIIHPTLFAVLLSLQIYENDIYRFWEDNVWKKKSLFPFNPSIQKSCLLVN